MTAVADRDEVRRSTRSGLIGLLGAAVNGACGFVLTAVIVRVFGAADSGALFTAIGLVSIIGPLCCLGADTGLMWALPRRERLSRDGARLLVLALVPTVALAAAVAVVGWPAAPRLGAALLTGGPDDAALIRLALVGVPVFVAATVLLAAVRATRPVSAYVGLQLVAVPIARPVLVGMAVVAGGSVVQGFAGWVLPLALAGVAAAVLSLRPLGIGRGAVLRPTPQDRREFAGFALPRALSTAIDASSMWVGVLLTSALAGPAAAGVFGAVGRYVLAGLLVMQGLRVAIAPQLSGLLGAGRRSAAAQIYRRTTVWIVLLSWPAYLLLAVFAPAFLALFGGDFSGGAAPLAVLAVAMMVNVGVGLVQTVLLMSGNSRGHLLGTVAGLAVNVAGCVLLIPRHGALGAAVAWSLGIVCENVVAAVLARRVLGEALFGTGLVAAAAAATAGTGVAAAAGAGLAGRGVPGLAVALAVLLALCAASLASPRVRRAVAAARTQLRPPAKQEALS
ncbi:lipopolysaccharide biosynthesis protein [Couchioplanes caeruleus]|uniref:lipopolysaccharide biosynthesis protein n=1 Tax=Couchioplanes caeruleus TaxID=56438 RepID=UPI0020BED741|nr:polysaccharide biosynthesis C-terminal domain-containing protein [Couchioplanes caeruleus]UQU66627.1 lipopolysaccharide biosynthesis protein [Couchioplanes caeruleus]